MKKNLFLLLSILTISGTIVAETMGTYETGASITDLDGAIRKGITVTVADGLIADSNFRNFEFLYSVTREREMFIQGNSYETTLGINYIQNKTFGTLNYLTSEILYENKQGLSEEISGVYNLDLTSSITGKVYVKQLFTSTNFEREDKILQLSASYNKNIAQGTASITGDWTPIYKEINTGNVDEDESTFTLTATYSQDINSVVSSEGYMSYVKGRNDASGYTSHKISKIILGVAGNYTLNDSFSLKGDLSHTCSLVDTEEPASTCASADSSSVGISLVYKY